ncbi:hypothetical protein BDQ17DRAFT_1172431, partial [Cyathus striatus]
MSSQHLELRQALWNWREEAATIKFGSEMVRTFGPYLLMPDETIERIIACGQVFKVKSASHLTKETSWLKEWVVEFGTDILAIVHAYFPLPTSSAS